MNPENRNNFGGKQGCSVLALLGNAKQSQANSLHGTIHGIR
jgi:hypothetical protein